MSGNRNRLLALSILSIVVVGLTIALPAPAAAINTQGAPFVDVSFGQLPNGVWYKVESITPGPPLLNATGRDVQHNLFAFDNHIYAVEVNDDWGVNLTYQLWFYRVILVSNPDGSARASGDEVRVTTTAILINGSYSEKHLRTMAWYNVTSLSMSSWQQLDGNQLTRLRNNILLASVGAVLAGNWIAAAYLLWGFGLSNNDTGFVTHSYPFAAFDYSIAEDYFPHFARSVNGVESEMVKIRHQLMGLVAYNDTNSNNIMDLNYTQVINENSGARYLGVTSSEARYVFKATSVHAVGSDWGAVPTYNASTGSVDWSISLSGVTGGLSLIGTTLSVPTSIDQVKFAFHFIRPNNGDEAGVKVDETIGTFANVPGNATLNRLSLAIAYFSYVESFQSSTYKLGMATNDNQPFNPEGNSTRYQPTVKITADGHESGYIRIGGDTYVWGNGSLVRQAYSNVMPWFFFSEHFSLVGNYSIAGVRFSKYTYFYEACFPKWGGYSIIHDPYFAVTTFSPGGEGSPLMLLIVAGAGIGLVAAVALLMTKRKKTLPPP